METLSSIMENNVTILFLETLVRDPEMKNEETDLNIRI